MRSRRSCGASRSASTWSSPPSIRARRRATARSPTSRATRRRRTSPAGRRRRCAAGRRPRSCRSACRWRRARRDRAGRGSGAGRGVRVTAAFPPGPTEAPVLQTARWLLRPIAFLESCRRRYGDTFSVMFQGFKTPLVMVSSPEVIRALYAERAHQLPPGRQVTLGPLVGPRSLLLLEGADHMSRRKMMLPPFHGERMRGYEAVVREVTERELDGWREGAEFAVHPSMQAITLEVIERAVFGVSARGPLHDLLRDLLSMTISRELQFSVLFGRQKPLEKLREMASSIDERLLAEIAARRARPGRRHLFAARAGALRGRQRDERPRGPRPADDAAAGRARDDRHRPGVDARPADAQPGRAAPRPGRRRRVPARGRRGVAAAAARGAPRRPQAGEGPRRRRRPPARRHRRHARDVARPHPPRRLPGPVRVPPGALPRQAPVDLHVDPVRRRHPPLPRRGVRRDGDADRPGRDPAPLRPAPGLPPRRARRPPQRDLLPRHGTRVIATRRT